MYDYHIHTSFSADCQTEVEDIIRTAIDKGIKEIAITDHYDPDYPDLTFPFELEFYAYEKKIKELSEKYNDKISILMGLELGIQHGETIKKCEQAANYLNFDFILGSFHSFNGIDLYKADYSKMKKDEIIYDFYSYVYECIKQFSNYDVLGHFDVIDRYVDFKPDYTSSMPIIKKILEKLISQGKGIEINTSSARYNMGNLNTPSKDILKLYKKLGGEVVTIGSDSHHPSHLGYDYAGAIELMKSLGFNYLSTFKKRKLYKVII